MCSSWSASLLLVLLDLHLMIWNIGGGHKFSKEESEENDLAQFLLRQDKKFCGGRISIRSSREK